MKKIIILCLILISALFLNGCVQQTPNCEGDWIEYQENCCLDANYNNECDQLEKYDGKLDCIDDSYCRKGALCNQGKCEKIGWSEPKSNDN